MGKTPANKKPKISPMANTPPDSGKPVMPSSPVLHGVKFGCKSERDPTPM